MQNYKLEIRVLVIWLAYAAITDACDSYTLRFCLADVAHWSADAINLYDLGNARVVFENSFVQSFKDALLSSNGAILGLQRLQAGMDTITKCFLNPYPDKGLNDSLLNNITFSARDKRIGFDVLQKEVTLDRAPIKMYYDNDAGFEVAVESDYFYSYDVIYIAALYHQGTCVYLL